jgi:tetratricopeptide (TPR) repeat protein
MAKGPAPFDQGLFLMHLHKGKEYFDQNQLQEAREELEAAYHLRPQDEKVLNLLGMAYFKLEMLPQAEEMYVTLASNNPDVYTLQSNLGLIRLKLDKLDLAEESLTRALELMPGNQKAHFYLGLLYEKWEKWDKALPHFEHAKAEKMIEKIKREIEEEKKRKNGPEKEPEMLAFEVLEVIEEKPVVVPDEITEKLRLLKPAIPPAPPTPAVPPLPPMPAAAEPPSLATMETDPLIQRVRLGLSATGKMQKADFEAALAKRAAEIRTPEPVVEEGGADTLFEQGEDLSKLVEEEPESPAQKMVAPPPPPPRPVPVAMSEDEEELVEDDGPHVAAEIEEGHIEEEEPLWEKTQPKLVVSRPEEPPAVSTSGAEITGPIARPVGSLFMAEDIAADISTFLAESRVEVEKEASSTDFVQEPPPAPVAEEVVEPEREASPEPVEQERIPSPQEVENETRDMGEEPLFEKEEPAADREPEVFQEPIPGVVEEPVAEVSAEPAQPEPAIVMEQPVIEVPVQIPVIERTQMMPLMQLSEPKPAEAPAIVEERPPTPEPPVVEWARTSKAATPAAQTYQPANLDQFSRDRFYVQPLIGADRFLLIDPHLLEIIVSGRIFCRRGTISSFSGSLQFGPWPNLQEEILVEVSGAGILFLADRRKEIFLISLNNESVLVESNHLLVAQSVLKIETRVFEDEIGSRSFSMFEISGRGTVALTCQTKPLTLNVHESMPVNIPADALIALSGHVNSEIMRDEELRKILMSAEDGTTFLRLTGSGDVVVEQGSLWGDRRAKKL